jgi:hypothetical protein
VTGRAFGPICSEISQYLVLVRARVPDRLRCPGNYNESPSPHVPMALLAKRPTLGGIQANK